MKDKNMSGLYISVDAGTLQSGYIVLENGWGKIKIKEFGIVENDEIFRLFDKYAIDRAVICMEMINPMGMRIGRSTIDTIFWIGRFFDRAKTLECEPVLIERQIVKKTLCHKMRANDSTIRSALIKIYGEPGVKKNPGFTYGIKSHIWQALACVTTYFIKEGIKIEI